MSTVDYDQPRVPAAEPEAESLDLLKERRSAARPGDDLGDVNDPDAFELPGFEIIDDELTTAVIPIANDEFRCAACFLVLHRRLLAVSRQGEDFCAECA